MNREGSFWRASVGFKNLAVDRADAPADASGSIVGIDRGVAVLAAAASADG